MEKQPIPKDFYQKPDQSLISECISCKKYILDDDTQYMLEKAVRAFPDIDASQTIFEYAICMDCAQKAQSRLSEESKMSIENLFKSKAVRVNSMEIAYRASIENKEHMDYCLLTGKDRQDCEEYQIYAYCHGAFLTPNTNTFMLSGEAMETIQGLLSPETKDELEDFKDKNFGLPPELEKLINSGDLILF